MSAETWEFVHEPEPHYCDLPDPKDFDKGDMIRCKVCRTRWRLYLTWFWRDPQWAEADTTEWF